ncbi:MAG: hypothetical protein ABL912_14320, partial [Novosphingobium sp.]
RDARDYAGERPVVAHPPCARWGQFAPVNQARYGIPVGSDDGCFDAAIRSVRKWGGVLEHPYRSIAWTRSLLRPDEWVAEVEQFAYGHPAKKRTWLVAVGSGALPELRRSVGKPTAYVSGGPGASMTSESRRAAGIRLLGRREREETPIAFAQMLVDIALGAV